MDNFTAANYISWPDLRNTTFIEDYPRDNVSVDTPLVAMCTYNNSSYSLALTSMEFFIASILFDRVLKIIITLVGFVGNGIIIVILIKRKNRNSSTSIYLTALAISDILVLVFGPLSHWLITTWNIDISRYGTVECKIYAFMQSTSVSISSWLLVAVTIERVICVTSPCRVKTYCTKKLAITFIFVIWLIMYVTDIHFLWGMGHNFNNHCEPLNQMYHSFLNFILPWIDFWTAFGFPALFLSVGNVLIIRRITLNRMHRHRLTYSSGLNSSSITPMLISTTVVFIVTMAPYYFVSVLMPFWTSDCKKTFLFKMINFWQPILRVVWESNAALNFALYFLSGSRFRKEVKVMLSCSCRKYAQKAGVFDHSFTAELIHRT